MFFYTDTADAPWTVIKSNDKKRARLNCMLHFLSTLDYPDKDFPGALAQTNEKTRGVLRHGFRVWFAVLVRR
jgi:hypothetical protein